MDLLRDALSLAGHFYAGLPGKPENGSRLYNLVHTEVLPAALAASSFAFHRTSLLAFALIWLCHIGFDRLIGAGLKYPTFFKDTHLQRV